METYIKELFTKYNNNYQSIKSCLSKNVELKNKIMTNTQYLPLSSNFSQRLFHLINDLYKLPKCYCNKDCSFLGFTKGYSKFCGRVCARKSNIIINQKLSNTEEAKEKKKETLLNKYGVENIFQVEEIKNKIKEQRDLIEEKRKQTNIEKYGYEQPSKNESVKEKIKQTNIEKYGISNFLCLESVRNSGKDKLNSDEVKEKRKVTNLEKYGVEFPMHQKYIFYRNSFDFGGKFYAILKPLFTEEEYLGCNRRNLYKFECVKCSNIFEDHLADGHIPRCLNCYPYSIYNSFKFENDFFDWFRSLNLKIYRRDRKQIAPLEIDFYLPELKIGIEFNELRSHAEVGNGKNKQYHLNKTELCLEKGIQLIQIFQDEWFFKSEVVKSIILSKLGLLQEKIMARKCEFREIPLDKATLFFKMNHLQGFPLKIKTNNFGLFYKNKLVEAVSICKSRYNENYELELYRACTKLNISVIGGFDKLIKNLPLQGSIVSYIDCRYFNGNSYKYWNYIGKTQPNYFYMDKKYLQRYSRLKFQKHKLLNKYNNLTEWENMQLTGYDRIWDCGNLIYSRNL